MRKYLLAKHWHYFIAAFIVPIVILVVGVLLPFYVLNGATIFIAVPLSIVVAQLVIYVWLWNVGKLLSDKLPFYISKEYSTFRRLITIPVIISVLIFIFWLIGASFIVMGYLSFSSTLISSLIFILPLWFLLLLSKVYCFYYAAKVLKSAELNRIVTFREFSKEFILFLLFPIGIWVIQPRLNKLVRQLA